ncbi:MAG TPA: D-alanyl-D-alanine carboxypeptidase [Streptosporangiaceae bacterium]|nr:D-alanyl-D-alanine carboxypeptidase [Streptosporangiaceae bacterium]
MRAAARLRAAALAGAAGVVTLALVPAGPAVAGAARLAHAEHPAQPGNARPDKAARQVVGGTRLASRGVVVNYPAGHPRRLPKVPASAYVIADATTGQVLAARDPHGEYAPASTLKMLTAITLIPRLDPDARLLTTSRAAMQEPNDVGILPGHRYKAADLFRALLLISANDAAMALTQATGSFDKGMALINAEAHHLQAYDVVAKLPNGLPARGQVVSAYDEALIARQALATPAFMKYDRTPSARFKVKNKKWVTLVNQNSLLRDYRGALGGKIGWTVKSKATYIGMARRHGVTLIVTVLHCTPLLEVKAGEALLTWGFAMDGKVRPVGTLVPPLQPAAASATHKKASPKSVQLSNEAAASSTGEDAGLAIGAGIAAALVFGLGALAVRRMTRSARRAR